MTSYICRMYKDKNYSNLCFSMDTSNLEYPDLSIYAVENMISSMELYNTAYIITVYTGYNYSGTSWVLRAPTNVSDFSKYGINDAIKSVKAVLVGYPSYGVTLFRDSNQSSRSQYFTVGDYPDFSSLPIGGDTVSSLYLYPKTAVQIFRHANYLNITDLLVNNTVSTVQSYAVASNDTASSMKVYSVV